ncbi:MAG: cation:proton antiporter [Cyclobacteriaceae bacterium]|nr:cation:proton antiporter [Cyclobacteriaceae bacterium]MCH8516773.1 cation:proton antiporter [Cyclobacteriaceae bacterium]
MDQIAALAEKGFYEFALILLFAALLGIVGKLLKQPLIVMFILLGILIGPAFLGIVNSKDQIEILAEIGISLLLFIVGLKLDLRIINSVGKIALLTGLGQVLFTSLVGYFISYALGFSSLHSFYIAVALTFSSTIIIVKLLSDKKEIDTLHGQIAIGFLIVQDIVVVLVMIVLSAMRQDGDDASLFIEISKSFGAGLGLLLFSLLFMKFVVPKLSTFLAKNQEVLVLFAIALAVGMAMIGELLNFSGEVGAFLAGVTLASSAYKDVISSRLVSLRDFLLLFFFVDLGANLDLSTMGDQIGSAMILSVFVLIGNPIIVLIIMGLFGYKKRTAFLAGLTVAQISEFSLIFAGLGLAIGHINNDVLGLITLVGLITIGTSTYMIIYSHQIFNKLAPYLSIFERANPDKEVNLDNNGSKPADYILIGLGRFGSRIADKLNQNGTHFIGVDFDPKAVKSLQKKYDNILYGDIEDIELLEKLPIHESKLMLISVTLIESTIYLIKYLERENYQGNICVIANNPSDKKTLEAFKNVRVLSTFDLSANNFYNQFIEMNKK